MEHELESHLADGLAGHVVALAVREAGHRPLRDDLQLGIDLADRHAAVGCGGQTRCAGRAARLMSFFLSAANNAVIHPRFNLGAEHT